MKKGIALEVDKLDQILEEEVRDWAKKYNKEWKSEEMGAEIASSIQLYHKFRADYIVFFQANFKALDPTQGEWLLNSMYLMLFSHWELIQRSAEQYSVDEQYKKMLDKGYAKIRSYKKQNKIPNLPTILYFEKVGKAKRFPFTPVFTIGIPMFDAYRQDWSAIPHELGHHIYWNSQFTVNNLTRTPLLGDNNIFAGIIDEAVDKVKLPLTDKALLAKKFNDWEEEIFAEVIGTQIGVEDDFAEAIWDKLRKRTNKVEDLFIDDGGHPLPLFLPYIRDYAKSVALSAPPNPTLDDEWGGELNLNPQSYMAKEDNPKKVSFSQIKPAMENVVQEICKTTRVDLQMNTFNDILLTGLAADAPTQKLIERALDTNFSFLEKNEFTCTKCGLRNQGTAGSTPCSKCGMLGSYLTAGYNFIVGA
jgi:hypothetical protein